MNNYFVRVSTYFENIDKGNGNVTVFTFPTFKEAMDVYFSKLIEYSHLMFASHKIVSISLFDNATNTIHYSTKLEVKVDQKLSDFEALEFLKENHYKG